MKKKIEIYVGIFVFIGLIMLAVMIIGFGRQKYSGRHYIIYSVFNFVSGIIKDAPVRYAGVDVGRVMNIVLFENKDQLTKVRIKLAIKQGAKIKKGSKAFINSLGMVGEKYIEILPGRNETSILKPGDTIYSIDPIAIEDIMLTLKKVLNGLESTLVSVNHIINAEAQDNIKASIVNIKEFSMDADKLAKKLNSIVNQINNDKSTVGKLIYSQDLYNELLGLIKGLREHGIFYKNKVKDTKKKRIKSKRNFSPRNSKWR